MAFRRFRRPMRRTFMRRGRSSVEVSQFYSGFSITNAASTTPSNPTITTTVIINPRSFMVNGNPAYVKDVVIHGIQWFTEYQVTSTVDSVNAVAQVVEGVWQDSVGATATTLALPTPNLFQNEFAAATEDEALLPKRILFRRSTLLQLGRSGAAGTPFSPGNFQASQSNEWRPFRTRRQRLNADRDVLCHTSCITNSTVTAVSISTTIYAIIRYRVIL